MKKYHLDLHKQIYHSLIMNYLQIAKLFSIAFIFTFLLTSCISKKILVDNQEVNYSEVNHVDVNTLLQSTYLPEKKDIPLILHNSNTGHYYSKNDDCSFKSTKITMQDYEDSLQTIKKPTKIITTYKNGLVIKWEVVGSENSDRATDYMRNADGILLKSISTKNGVEENRFEYRYDNDRIYEIYIVNNFIQFYTTYFLNEKKQCFRKISQSPNHEIDSDYQYFYDNKGRNIKIIYGTYENIFAYRNESDYTYSTFMNYDLDPRTLRSSMESIKDGKKRTMISRDENNNMQLKMIFIAEPNCDTKAYTYNSKNKLTGVSVSTVE